MLVTKPPMGWNSWNTFGGAISDKLIRETADAIIETGLRDAGYEYVVIDDCWALKNRDEKGNMVPDPEKFPDGMRPLADYLHERGLKFGMYSCNGTRTCAGYPGSFEYEFQDAKNFADWGVDYLKYDNCFKPDPLTGRFLYNRMSMALKASGRDIVFSACNWGAEDVHKWIRSTGSHLYRSTGDISDSFVSYRDIFMSQLDLAGYSAPGCFNDLDMLICGMYGKGNVGIESGCTDTEYRTHFAMWCMLSSPLMIGCDVRSMSDATRAILTNKELIAIDRDPDARPPFMVTNRGHGCFSMMKHLENGEYALAFFNINDVDKGVGFEFFDMGLSDSTGYGFDLTDIFTGETYSKVYNHFDVPVEAHGCKVFRARLVPVR